MLNIYKILLVILKNTCKTIQQEQTIQHSFLTKHFTKVHTTSTTSPSKHSGHSWHHLSYYFLKGWANLRIAHSWNSSHRISLHLCHKGLNFRVLHKLCNLWVILYTINSRNFLTDFIHAGHTRNIRHRWNCLWLQTLDSVFVSLIIRICFQKFLISQQSISFVSRRFIYRSQSSTSFSVFLVKLKSLF